MTLSVSLWSRLAGPVVLALTLIVIIETGIQLRYHPDFWQKTTWLVHDPYRGEPFDRVMLHERLGALEDTQPEIISVGDSSGFFSLQSKIVNRYTQGVRYLSLNTGANYAYLGYRSLAEYMLRKQNSRIKWVVIYAFPQLVPVEWDIREANLSPYVYDTLVGPLSVLTPPSTFLSPYAKFKIFDNINWHFDEPMNNQPPALQLRAQVKEAMGWLPEFDVRADRINDRSLFHSDVRDGILPRLGLARTSSIYAVYDDFNEMAKSYGAHLAIAFAPISERGVYPDDTYISENEDSMAKFSQDHPDVKFLFPLISRWGAEKFGAPNHVSREYTFLSSMRLGRALDRLMTKPDSFPTYTNRFAGRTITPIQHEFSGPPNPEFLKAAFAFYLYTQTLDKSYEGLISRRVHSLLENDQAYQYMMEDALARARLFAEKKIVIGFDLSQMRARPISASGISHCNSQQGTQWVQVDGTLNFIYKSPESAPPLEPVQWPENSNIDIPLIKEDGLWKFDGYCPETGLAISNLGDPVPTR